MISIVRFVLILQFLVGRRSRSPVHVRRTAFPGSLKVQPLQPSPKGASDGDIRTVPPPPSRRFLRTARSGTSNTFFLVYPHLGLHFVFVFTFFCTIPGFFSTLDCVVSPVVFGWVTDPPSAGKPCNFPVYFLWADGNKSSSLPGHRVRGLNVLHMI